jgi:ABC-type multidrug transport system fused ATPase/permease subunit
MSEKRYLWRLWLVRRHLVLGLAMAAVFLVGVEGVGLGLVLVLLGAGGSAGGMIGQYQALAALLRRVHSLPIDSRILLAAGTLLGTTLLRGALQFYYHLLTVRLRQAVETPLQQGVFERFHRLPLTEIQRMRQGNLLLLLNQYPRQIGELTLKLGRTLASVVILVAYTVVALLVSWPLTLLSVVLLVLVSGVLRPFLSRRLRRAALRSREQMQQAGSTGQEHLAAVKTIRLFGRESWSRLQYFHQLEAYHRHEYRAEGLSGLTRPLFNFLNVAVISAVLLAATVFLEGSSQVVLAHLALFLVVAFRLTGPLGELAEMQTRLTEAGPIVGAVMDFLHDSGPLASRPAGTRVFAGLRERLGFEDVTFGYTPTEPAVLHGLTLSITQGQMTAIVGASGAGKSTMAALVSRLHDPSTGRLTVDGVDLREYDPVSWRRHLAFVSQDVFLFHTTVRENLRFARPDATEAQIQQACRLAQAHEFILGLPQGYDTSLQERGLRLSGGQRQRIALARALLVDADLLVLDEATSELDGPTEQAIHESLARERQGRTTLIIAHRLSTVRNADRICVLDHGRLVEEGTHATLLAAGGAYARMVG